MLSSPPVASYVKSESERRQGFDRRQRQLQALFYGIVLRRRRHARREGEPRLGHLDWYPARWIAAALCIVVLSCADAFLTLNLLAKGAYEVNPVMGALIAGSPWAFVLVKIGLTSVGVLMLTLVSRMHAFGGIPVSVILYLTLSGYVVLIVYELELLQKSTLPFMS